MVNIQNDKIASNVPSAWYSSLDNFIVKGKNAEIWDSEGNRYLDYVGGYAVLNTGHLHPTVVEKVKNQLDDFSHSCFAFAPHENAVKLSEELNRRYPINTDTKTFMVSMIKQITISFLSFLFLSLIFSEERTFSNKGLERTYLLYLPENLEIEAPLVVVMHGGQR